MAKCSAELAKKLNKLLVYMDMAKVDTQFLWITLCVSGRFGFERSDDGPRERRQRHGRPYFLSLIFNRLHYAPVARRGTAAGTPPLDKPVCISAARWSRIRAIVKPPQIEHWRGSTRFSRGTRPADQAPARLARDSR